MGDATRESRDQRTRGRRRPQRLAPADLHPVARLVGRDPGRSGHGCTLSVASGPGDAGGTMGGVVPRRGSIGPPTLRRRPVRRASAPAADRGVTAPGGALHPSWRTPSPGTTRPSDRRGVAQQTCPSGSDGPPRRGGGRPWANGRPASRSDAPRPRVGYGGLDDGLARIAGDGRAAVRGERLHRGHPRRMAGAGYRAVDRVRPATGLQHPGRGGAAEGCGGAGAADAHEVGRVACRGVEHVAWLHGHERPAWVDEPERFLETTWVLSPIRSARMESLMYAPAAFLRHGAIPDPRDLDSRGGEQV